MMITSRAVCEAGAHKHNPCYHPQAQIFTRHYHPQQKHRREKCVSHPPTLPKPKHTYIRMQLKKQLAWVSVVLLSCGQVL